LKLKQDIIAHITQKATVLKGELLEWDVINEPFMVRRNKPYNDNTGIWLYGIFLMLLE
jgi:hypothetical protein